MLSFKIQMLSNFILSNIGLPNKKCLCHVVNKMLSKGSLRLTVYTRVYCTAARFQHLKTQRNAV